MRHRLAPPSASIGHAELDGTGVNQGFLAVSMPGSLGLAVDDEYVYWTNYNLGTIGRAGLDGTGVDASFIAGGSNPAYVAVDGAFIYWTNHDSNTIGRAKLDGTGVDQSFITGASAPSSVAVSLVPEPAASRLVLLGVGGLAAAHRRGARARRGNRGASDSRARRTAVSSSA